MVILYFFRVSNFEVKSMASLIVHSVFQLSLSIDLEISKFKILVS